MKSMGYILSQTVETLFWKLGITTGITVLLIQNGLYIVREENINNLLQFLQSLREKEKPGEGFTPQSIAKETKYQPSTIRKYLSSFLRAYCIFNKESKLWYCSEIIQLTDYDFLELMTQNKTSISLSDKDKFVLNLFQKSKNAFLAAIQLYNNPNQLSSPSSAVTF